MSFHIFIVDDDPAIGRFSCIALELEGFDVTAFTSPLNASRR